MAKSKKSLAETHPELAREWHPTKNGNLNPTLLSYGSGKKVWWKCDKGDDHEWQASINNRSMGRRCPYCSGFKFSISESLRVKNPDLAKEWHPSKNNDLTPSDLRFNSSKKVWWKCKISDDHNWKASISHRNNGRGCPICSGHKTTEANSLKALSPDLLQYWDYYKNSEIQPDKIAPKSNKKVWWKCPKGDDHKWEATPNNVSSGRGCPICSGQLVVKSNSLEYLRPDLAKEWHPTKNGDLSPSMFTTGSTNKKIWWKCKHGVDHEWQATISKRAKSDQGCPICSGHKTVRSNSIVVTNNELLKEWHPKLNLPTTPEQVSHGSHKKIWWKCPKGDDHVWQAAVQDRVKGDGCTICSNHKVVYSNCLSTTHPEIASSWHPTKNNRLLPSMVTAGSSKKVWWKCHAHNDHEWAATIASRKNGNNCPYCTLTPQSKQELIITFELKTLFGRIDPKGFKTRLDGRLRAIDIFIPKLNLCIEFDGSYWHKGKREIDKIKSNLLLKEGYSVIRVREEPLKKIHDTDVISKQPYNGKQVTNDILLMILSMYDLDSELIKRIKDYQSKGDLQNERGLNRYIDKILKEKAEKK